MSGSVLAQDRELQAAIPLVEECLRHAVRRLRTRMLTRSGTDTPVRLVQTRLCTVAELIDDPDATNISAWAGFYVERGAVSGFAAVDGTLLERLTARLFGDPTPPQEPHANRPATDVELRVATRMCDELFVAVEAHWPVRPAPRMVSRPALGNRHGVVDATVSTAVVACTLECGAEDDPMGRILFALPVVLLRGVVGVVDVPASRTAPKRGGNYDRLLGCEVEMIVELTRLTTSLGTLRALRVGDQLPLGAVNEAQAFVNGRPSFAGDPGACDGIRSFRVSRRVLGISAQP